jgi:hypothetical protein
MSLSLPEGVNTEPTDMVEGFRVNTPDEQILENMRHSIRLQLPQFDPQPPRKGEICIVGGGWSLDDTKDELLDVCWKEGAPIIALNGAAKWLMERNIRPAVQMVLDARPENAEFIIDIPGCKYMIASQCAPETFAACEGLETYIFQSVGSDDSKHKGMWDVLNTFYDHRWVNVSGGSTVGLRAITLAKMMGFQFQHLFGIDSCYSPDGEHHAYPQALNDGEGSSRMYLALKNGDKSAGKEFRCSTWQASQAQQFKDFLAVNGNHFRLHIHGDGLLAYMLKTGASLGG